MESRPALDRPAARLARFTGLACVGLVLAIASAYYLLPLIGRAAAGELATAGASVVLALLVVVGIAALYCLQRLLESEEESSQ